MNTKFILLGQTQLTVVLVKVYIQERGGPIFTTLNLKRYPQIPIQAVLALPATKML